MAGWLMYACWSIAGQRQAIACRKAYLRSLLHQEMGWFDTVNQTELSSQFAADTYAYQGAIGEKFAIVIMTVATMVAGFVYAFATGWLLALVMLGTIPVIAISGYLHVGSISTKN